MNITKQHLDDAVQAQIISAQQSEQLCEFLTARAISSPKFDFTHIFYYLGGLIAIAALSLFMNLVLNSFGGAGVVVLCLAYGVAGLKLTNYFKNKGLHIPAGICGTFVIALTPVAIYGLQKAVGVWPEHSVNEVCNSEIRWNLLWMELSTLLVGSIVAWKYRYPFLVMPIAVTLWYFTMDITVLFEQDVESWTLRLAVSMYSGLLIIALAFWVDIRSRNTSDYAFWLYLFGAVAFWSALSLQESDNELAKFGYFAINILMIFAGALVARKIFVVLGALGCCGYFYHLSNYVFYDSWLFPISLILIGLGIVYLGVWWQKYEAKVTAITRSILPMSIRERLESNLK